MISVGTTDGLRADVEQTLFDLRIEAGERAEEAVAGFELLDWYGCVFGLEMAEVIVFAIGFRFDFALEITLNFLFILLLAIHFALVVAFAVGDLRRVVVDEVNAHYLRWGGLVNGQER